MIAPSLPHRRGLDGLRGLAVAAVLLYHAEVSWVPGGFLGVDVFFAISGYLITSLLLAEATARGAVSLRRFWIRRARRLLPAVVALLVGVTIAALVGANDAVERLRGDVLAALTYSSNWWQIIRGETYFESFGRPPLLRHLWSLAVEEQLYIVLPLAFALVARRGWLPHRRRLAIGVLVVAAGSLVLLNRAWNPDDPSRAWFGSDTRAGALLVGVAFALLWPMSARARWRGTGRLLIDAVAVGSLGVLGVLVLGLHELDAGLPKWGFALAALASGALVVAVTSPTSRVHRYLGMRPLAWLGTRSYAIYLWHWPVFVMTRPDLDIDVHGWPLLALRVAITVALAELSWRLVEQPFRTGSFTRRWFELRQAVRIRVAFVGTSVVAVLAAALAVGLSAAATSATPELLATVAKSPTTATTMVRLTTTTSAPTTTTTAAPAPTTVPPPQPFGQVLAVGDSVMLAAKDELIRASGGRIAVDAAISRQVNEGLDMLQRYRDIGAFSQVSAVVVHLGTNTQFDDDQFNRLAAITADVPRVVVLNIRVPRSWEERSNAAINGGAGRFAFMRLADWYGTSAQPGMLANDGVHPSFQGARAYADITMKALEGAPPQPPPPTTTTTAPPPATPPPSTTTTTSASPVPVP